MARVTFEKGSKEQKAFLEFWNICQEFWEPEENDEYWERYIEATNRFLEDYGRDNEMVRHSIINLTTYLETKMRRNRK